MELEYISTSQPLSLSIQYLRNFPNSLIKTSFQLATLEKSQFFFILFVYSQKIFGRKWSCSCGFSIFKLKWLIDMTHFVNHASFWKSDGWKLSKVWWMHSFIRLNRLEYFYRFQISHMGWYFRLLNLLELFSISLKYRLLEQFKSQYQRLV